MNRKASRSSPQARQRSRAYPAIELREAFQILIERLRALLGVLKPKSEVASLLGYSSTSGGLGVRKIVALVSYGFLEKRGNRYTVSSFGEYLLSLDRQGREWDRAIRSAFLRPPLFEELMSTYKASRRLPVNLSEVLESQFEITPKASSSVASVFLKSGQFAGALDGLEIVPEEVFAEQTSLAQVSLARSEEAEPGKTTSAVAAALPPVLGPESIYAKFGLPRRRTAVISVEMPDDADDEDRRIVLRQLNYWVGYLRDRMDEKDEEAKSRDDLKSTGTLMFKRGKQGES